MAKAVKFAKTQRGAEAVRVEKAAMLAFGGGLYLKCTPAGGKSWVVRAMRNGKRVNVGLGSLSTVALAEAQAQALEIKTAVRAGRDVLADREETKLAEERAATTFLQVAQRVYDEHRPTWRSKKHSDNWWANVRIHMARLHEVPISEVTKVEVLSCLSPIWLSKPETARRCRAQLKVIFEYAMAHDLYSRACPVTQATGGLPKQRDKSVSLRSMEWQELPGFMKRLSQREAMTARCLEFVILTGLRSGSGRTIRWSDVELDHEGGPVATIRAENMKDGKDFRLPLSEAAVEVLEAVRGHGAELVFPSPQRGERGDERPLTDMALLKLLQERMHNENITVHGFRATFRTWSMDNGVDREVAEVCLAHAVGGAVERAYKRSDLLEKRRPIMQAWAGHCYGAIDGLNIVSLRKMRSA